MPLEEPFGMRRQNSNRPNTLGLEVSAGPSTMADEVVE